VTAVARAEGGEKLVCANRRARHEYEILDSVEAGLVLRGTEVKSLRAGQASIAEAFAVVDRDEAWLVDAQIQPYAFGNIHNHDPKRRRKLLLHRREIAKLTGKVKEKGLALIPLRIYFKHGLAKVEIGVGRGKKLHDKRETIKRRDALREAAREVRERVR
jgi:SsrA-binding protein